MWPHALFGPLACTPKRGFENAEAMLMLFVLVACVCVCLFYDGERVY